MSFGALMLAALMVAWSSSALPQPAAPSLAQLRIGPPSGSSGAAPDGQEDLGPPFAPTSAVIEGEQRVGRASVIGGDAIEIAGTRIRLHGVDAPERLQECQDRDGAVYRCGERAALALADRIQGATLTCIARDVDRYGRMLANCFVRGEDLNAWLVRSGLAVADRDSSDYVEQEAAARSARVGLWAGRFTGPSAWRQGERR